MQSGVLRPTRRVSHDLVFTDINTDAKVKQPDWGESKSLFFLIVNASAKQQFFHEQPAAGAIHTQLNHACAICPEAGSRSAT